MATVPLGHFTTYLGHIIKESGIDLTGRTLDKKTLKLTGQLVPKRIMGRYEAILTYICYFTRIIYENRPRKILKSYNLLKYSPLTFNKGMSYLTYSPSLNDKIERSAQLNKKKPSGYLLYDKQEDLPLSITVFDYTKPQNQSLIFPNKKIMVISFRGTLSLVTAFKDLNYFPKSLHKLYGTFNNESRDNDGNPFPLFGAHGGFVNGLTAVYQKILARVKELLNNHPGISSIFVTGQSLGGAYSHLMGLGLAQEKKLGKINSTINIHIISFGAPRVFTYYSRNVFNKLLLEGYMTLDRVTNRARYPDVTMLTTDPVPLIPMITPALPTSTVLAHPGFMILNKEIMTQSRSGRTKHIRELRSELADINPGQSFFSSLVPNALKVRNYNALPEYKEYLDHFLDCIKRGNNMSPITVDEYKGMINSTPYGTVRRRTGRAEKVFDFVEEALYLSDAELEQLNSDAAYASMEQVVKVQQKEEGKLTAVVDSAKKEQGVVKEQVKKAYGPGGIPQEGGGEYGNIYDKQTVLEQPNHLVYSCSQITSPGHVPSLGCHLGYLGVSFTGAAINVGSGTLSGTRDYNSTATLYCTDDGVWTYIPDTMARQAGGTRKKSAKKLAKTRRDFLEKKSAKTRRR